MKHNIFISYPDSHKDLAGNLRDRFNNDYGINTWVYPYDLTLGADLWIEIENKIDESELILYIITNGTKKSSGQKKELALFLDKLISSPKKSKCIPIFTDGVNVKKDCPEKLKHINGTFINGQNIKSKIDKIAQSTFPDLVKSKIKKPWKIPNPGSWLEISETDEMIDEYFEVGDLLYFRAISPMGLFECYSPKHKDLFWILPENVTICADETIGRSQQESVPVEYSIMGMIEIQRLGWEAWRKKHKK